MKNYQYRLLRYAHDQFTGEFVNLGVIVYSPELHFLKCKVVDNAKRVKGLFPDVSSSFLLSQLRSVVRRTKQIASQQSDLIKLADNLQSITSMILPPDDSALHFSETKYAMDIDFDLSLNDLFEDLVIKYEPKKAQTASLSDDDVWRNKYKKYFDRYNISTKLIPHEVSTKNDIFNFEKAWKNEVWHCYQPISFDLKDADRIKDKVYKWSGKLDELHKTNEKIHLTFLTTISDEHKFLEDFILKSLDKDSKLVEVDVIKESGAEKLAKQIKELMDEHESHEM
jgi:hypothetical protein